MFRKPVFGDLRKAKRAYPWDRAEAGNKIGYRVDDLLMCLQLVELNGELIENYGYRDVIDRRSEIPLQDQQAISSLMGEAFFLSTEHQNEAYERARLVRRDAPAEYFEIKASDTPSGRFSCRFYEPTGKAQMIAEQQYTNINKIGTGLEEYLFSYCLTHVNGEPVHSGRNNLDVLDGVDIADIQYAVTFFYALSSLDEEGRTEVKKNAQAILQQLQKPVTASATPMPAPMMTPTVALS